MRARSVSDVCAASLTLLHTTLGQDLPKGMTATAPDDVAALRRCRLVLLEHPDLAVALPRMGALGRPWAQIASFWDDLCLLHDLESPDWPLLLEPAPQTGAMLASILDGTEGRKPF